MALNVVNQPLFSQAWVDGLKHIPEAGMAGEVRIYLPGAEGGWNDQTNDWDAAGPDTVLYAGKARIQPIRSAADKDTPGNATTIQNVLVSVPWEVTAEDIRPRKHFVEVTASPLNPQLTGFQYIVHEVLDSSNPIEKTIYCQVNQETVVG